MTRELVKDHEVVKFEWNESSLETDEVHVYRHNLKNGDGHYWDDILSECRARHFWADLLSHGFKLKPLLPPSCED